MTLMVFQRRRFSAEQVLLNFGKQSNVSHEIPDYHALASIAATVTVYMHFYIAKQFMLS